MKPMCGKWRAGLIEVTLSDGSPWPVTCTRAITDAGWLFLRTFPGNYRFCEAREASERIGRVPQAV
jgi:hypothetical protein